MVENVFEMIKETAVIIGALITILGGLTMLSGNFRQKIQKHIKKLFKEEFDKIDTLSTQLKEIQQLNEEQSVNIQEIGITQGLLVTAMKDDLREKLNVMYYKYLEKGEVPQFERERGKITYEDYRSLGGNSYMEDMFKRFLAIPIEKKKNT